VLLMTSLFVLMTFAVNHVINECWRRHRLLLHALVMLSRTRLDLGDNDYYNIKHVIN